MSESQNLQLSVSSDLVFVNKPQGIATHSPHTDDPTRHPGMCELVAQFMPSKLRPLVVHRLDAGTTGALLFALTRQRASEVANWFAERKVKKTYLLVTEAPRHMPEFGEDLMVRSQILPPQNPKISRQQLNLPWLQALPKARVDEPKGYSETRFRLRKRSPWYCLWEAHPATGRAHQIRIHAAQAGMPILGDTLYSGKVFPHLCLHAESIVLPDGTSWNTPAPIFFERMGMLRDPELIAILSMIDRRQRLFHFLSAPSACLRLGQAPALTLATSSTRQIRGSRPQEDSNSWDLDLFGPELWLESRSQLPATIGTRERWEFVCQLLGRSRLTVVHNSTSQKTSPLPRETFESQTRQWQTVEAPHQEPKPATSLPSNSNSLPSSWKATENNLCFELRRHQGNSPGLFLDHRENRRWLLQNASELRVLNLFSYTCGFSLAAARGGARRVTSVDTHRGYLEWGKINFRYNDLEPDSSEWICEDVLTFLKRAKKRQQEYDRIICDPPSFGRSQKGSFRLEKDWEELFIGCLSILSANGVLLFASNFEKWNRDDWHLKLKEALARINSQAKAINNNRNLTFHLAKEAMALPALDHGFPHEKQSTSSFFVLASHAASGDQN